MKFHTFGDRDNPKIILLHGVMTPWQMWDIQIESYMTKYYVIVPALNGHQEDSESEFHSVEHEALEIEKYCIENYHNEIYSVMGVSMGGIIAFHLWKRNKLNIHHIVMDGSPLVSYSRILAKFMTKNYLDILHKSKERHPKTMENFSKYFLPKRHLESFLRIADNMSDETIINMINSVSRDMPMDRTHSGQGMLYLHGTALNEILAKKTAKKLKKTYPQAEIVALKGDAHCHKALFEAEHWLQIVEEYSGI